MLENNYFNLFLGVPDTDFAKLIEGAVETGSIYSEIYKKIESDLDRKALLKKRERILDSTAVSASSSWPTDAAVIFRLFRRIQIQG